MVVGPTLLKNHNMPKDKDADDDDVDDRMKSTIPTFQDNKPGTESMHDFKDGLKRHWNGKGSDTLVKIGFGELGKIDLENMTQAVCEELHRDLITWNPRARLCELDPYTSYEYYDECQQRERNKGLFTANQNFNPQDPARQRACATRQDSAGCANLQNREGNNGNRYGYECPEERDYYPYWHPTPWRDIAVLTDDTSQCAFYQAESENVKRRGSCELLQHDRREHGR